MLLDRQTFGMVHTCNRVMVDDWGPTPKDSWPTGRKDSSQSVLGVIY